MSSIKVKLKLPGKTKILEIGLNIKHDRDYLCVLRWARWGQYWKTSEDWEYSESAVSVLNSYMTSFPQLWMDMESSWLNGRRMFQLEDLFPRNKFASREIEKVALWVCKLPCYNLPWSSAYSEYLSEAVVENTSKLTSICHNELLDELESLNPNHIYVASKPWAPVFTDKFLEFKLGHRVINLNPYYYHYVPFGAEGTVVALIDSDHAEVLWDDIVMKSNKTVVPVNNILNLTYPLIVIKRGNQEKHPIFRGKSYNDSSFKPEIFNKKSVETPEEIIKKAISQSSREEIKLDPNAPEFSIVASQVDPNLVPAKGGEYPSVHDFPIPFK